MLDYFTTNNRHTQELFKYKYIKELIVLFWSQLLLLFACFSSVLTGANDGGNIFGLFTESNLINERNARFICAVSAALGALFLGKKGTSYISALVAPFTPERILIIAVTACIVMLVFTMFGMPVSSSHCLYCSIIGTAIKDGVMSEISVWAIPLTIITVPLAAFAVSALFSAKRYYQSVPTLPIYLCIAAGGFALGANNIGLSSGLCSNDGHYILPLFLAVGVYYFSGRVSETIGRKISKLNKTQAIHAQLSSFLVTLLFAIIGIPTSSSHAIVGGTSGGGLQAGIKPNGKILLKIVLSWIISPVISLVISYLIA